MKKWCRLITFIPVLMIVSCQTMQETYEQQWKPELGQKEQETIDKFKSQNPDFLRKVSTPSADELVEYVDEATNSPAGECIQSDDYKGPEGDKSIGALDPKTLASVDVPNPEELLKPLGPIPAQGGGVNYRLPDPGTDSEAVVRAGYYLYGQGDGKTYGTERTIWRMKAAGKLLAKQGIVMGVGDISSRNGRTSGHAEHQGGNDVDLRLINSDSYAQACTVSQKSCYNKDKTFTMIKTLIDVDPQGFDKVLIK